MKQIFKYYLGIFCFGFGAGIGALILGILISVLLNLDAKAIVGTIPTYVAEALMMGSASVVYEYFVAEGHKHMED